MPEQIWEWLSVVLATSGVVGGVGFILRDTIARYFSKSLETHFDQKIERFKADIRDNETELNEIRSHLMSSRRSREDAIARRRLDAAEAALRIRYLLSQMHLAVEYMKLLDGDKILEDGENLQVIEFIQGLLRPLDVDERISVLGQIDRAGIRLYLSEDALKVFELYEMIVLSAVMTMKLYSIPLKNKKSLMKTGTLSSQVIALVPASKDGFDKFGEAYLYEWVQHFYDLTLQELRKLVSGANDHSRDASFVEQLALDSRKAQVNVRASLAASGLSDSLLKPVNASHPKGA